ncbi:MAG: hypothetical protein R3C00_02965 [Hyphomonas sp.]
MSGARFVLLKGKLARLERAGGFHAGSANGRTHGYTRNVPTTPLLVQGSGAGGYGSAAEVQRGSFSLSGSIFATDMDAVQNAMTSVDAASEIAKKHKQPSE